MLWSPLTCQLAVVQLEAVQRVGSEQQHVLLRVDGLQLLQRGLPAADSLHKQTRRDATHAVERRRLFFWGACGSPHTGLGGPSPAAWTRRSGSSRRAPGGGCCPRRYTGASAFGNRTPGLRPRVRWWGFCDGAILPRSSEEKRSSPVVKRSGGLDRVRDGTAAAVAAGWGAGGREVEAGEDWVRIRGW